MKNESYGLMALKKTALDFYGFIGENLNVNAE
jgi:hypothetical protein